ncbi:10808_t:CDS:2, partial [Funneliformis geosporum]
FTNLEQRDEEKATLIAKLDDDIKEIKQSSASTSSRKNIQGASACEGLIKEISTSISCNTSIQNQLRGTSHDIISQVTEISLTSGQGKSDILQNIANLYEKACDAEDVSIKANQ